jgi:hypothetical protein
MAVNVNATELDQTIDKMLGPSMSRMQALGAALNGAGAEAAAAYKAMSSFASAQPEVGKKAAESILTLRNDPTLPRDHRLLEGNERHSTATTMMKKLNDGAHAAHDQLESVLTSALLPGPHKDPAQRLLIRDGLRTRYAHLDGERLVGALVKRFGENQDHDGELLSSFGADFLAGAGVTEDEVGALRAQATAHYIGRADGSKQQQAARKALGTMRELNVKGHLAAYAQAGRLHLTKADDSSPQAQAIQDARAAARDRKS